MKYFLLVITVLALLCKKGYSETWCFLNGCFCEDDPPSISIDCIDNKEIHLNNFSSIKNFNQINLKLKGPKSLEALANGFLNDIQLYLLDLSENQNNMELYLDKVNIFSSIVELNLSRNKIPIIKKRIFFNLIYLEYLDLSNNEIFYIEDSAFYGLGLDKLTYLNLTKNQLTKIEPHYFAYLPNLTNLILDYNQLIQIKNNSFDSMSKLVNLSIKFNKIKQIEPDAFRMLRNLSNIWLNHNKLSNINQVFFNNFTLDLLNLSRNRLTEFNNNRTIAISLDLSFNFIIIFSI